MIGEPENPVNVKLAGTDVEPGKLILIGLLSLAPVAVAILMQHPALRQALQMRAWNSARAFCRGNARAWARLEAIASTRYDIARL